MRRLGRFLVAQTEPSGAVLAYYDEDAGAPVAGEYSKYYTGEAYWALALLHRTFPGEGWGEAADRVGAYLADVARRGRGPLAADPRPLGRLRRRPRPSGFPSAPAAPLTDPEIELRAQPGRLLRQRDPLGQPAGGPLGRAGATGERAPRRRLRGDERGAHRMVAGRAKRAGAGRPRGPGRRARRLASPGCMVREQADAAGRRRHPRSRAGRGRLVHRRRDPHGRPAARPRRPPADDPGRRGARGSSPVRRRPRRRGCGRRRCCSRSIPARAALAIPAGRSPAASAGPPRRARGRDRRARRCSRSPSSRSRSSTHST